MYHDNFDRANETPLGPPYGQQSTLPQFNLSSNHLVGSGNDAHAIIDTGVADTEFTVAFVVDATNTFGIIVGYRSSDKKHLLFFRQGGSWWVYRLTDTTVNETIAFGSVGGATTGPITLKVVAAGDSYEFWNDDGVTSTMLWSGTVTTFSRDNAVFGFRAGTSATTVEDVSYIDAPFMEWRDDFERLTIGVTAPNDEPYLAVGAWSITSGKPQSNTSALSVLPFDAFDEDVIVSTQTFGREIVTDPHQGVVARYVDSDNYVSAQLRDDEHVYLVARIAGTDTEWGVSSDLGTTDAVQIDLEVTGNEYIVRCNGVEEITFTDVDDTFHSSVHGLFTVGGTASFEYLLVTTGLLAFIDPAHVVVHPSTLALPPFIDPAHVVVHPSALAPIQVEFEPVHVVVHAGALAPMSPPSQQFEMAPAVRGPVAYGPAVAQEGVTVAPLTARLFRRSAPNTQVAEMDESFARRWQDQLNEAGSGEVALTNDDPVLALVGTDDMVRFELYGTAAFTFLVRERETVTLDPGEEHEQVTTFTGPGHLAVLEEAVVYPSRGVDSLPVQEDRAYDFSSVDYDDSWWATAQVLAGGTESTPAWNGVLNQGKPVDEASWIGPTVATQTYAPGGRYYLRRKFTVTAEVTDIIIYMVADDLGDLYLDGTLVLSTSQWVNDASNIASVTVPIDEGEHTLAAVVFNSLEPAIIEGEPFNPSAMRLSVHPIDPATAEVLPGTVAISDGFWKIVEYPPVPPGFTVGGVMLSALAEAQNRDALDGVRVAFSAEVDSDGNPWELTSLNPISTKVGTDLLTFFRELTATYCDIWMAPGSFTLYAWRADGRGEPVDVTLAPAPALDPSSGNLAGLTHRQVF